jgi:hypothetical protein
MAIRAEEQEKGKRVTAWRDGVGHCGISIHSVGALGWDNVVSEVMLIGDEVETFLAECKRAWERAQAFAESTHEQGLRPYGPNEDDD